VHIRSHQSLIEPQIWSDLFISHEYGVTVFL
jgi:hypothetical protein